MKIENEHVGKDGRRTNPEDPCSMFEDIGHGINIHQKTSNLIFEPLKLGKFETLKIWKYERDFEVLKLLFSMKGIPHPSTSRLPPLRLLNYIYKLVTK